MQTTRINTLTHNHWYPCVDSEVYWELMWVSYIFSPLRSHLVPLRLELHFLEKPICLFRSLFLTCCSEALKLSLWADFTPLHCVYPKVKSESTLCISVNYFESKNKIIEMSYFLINLPYGPIKKETLVWRRVLNCFLQNWMIQPLHFMLSCFFHLILGKRTQASSDENGALNRSVSKT